MTTHTMRDVTRAAMLLFGRLLAEDLCPLAHRAETDGQGLDRSEKFFASAGREMLEALDRLDVGPDETADRDMQRLALGSGELWLRLAESMAIEECYIQHVLHFHGRGGHPGSRYALLLLRTIEAADEVNRDALALACPEYVGLMRASWEPGGLGRLEAVALRMQRER